VSYHSGPTVSCVNGRQAFGHWLPGSIRHRAVGTGIRYDAKASETAIFLIRGQGCAFTTLLRVLHYVDSKVS